MGYTIVKINHLCRHTHSNTQTQSHSFTFSVIVPFHGNHGNSPWIVLSYSYNKCPVVPSIRNAVLFKQSLLSDAERHVNIDGSHVWKRSHQHSVAMLCNNFGCTCAPVSQCCRINMTNKEYVLPLTPTTHSYFTPVWPALFCEGGAWKTTSCLKVCKMAEVISGIVFAYSTKTEVYGVNKLKRIMQRMIKEAAIIFRVSANLVMM